MFSQQWTGTPDVCNVYHVMDIIMTQASPVIPCPGVPAAGGAGEAAQCPVSGGAAEVTLHQVTGHQPTLEASHGAGHEVPEETEEWLRGECRLTSAALSSGSRAQCSSSRGQ